MNVARFSLFLSLLITCAALAAGELDPSWMRSNQQFAHFIASGKSSITLSKSEIDNYAYKEALFLHINTREDWVLPMQMSVIATLAQQGLSGEEIARAANQFEKEFRARAAVAATGEIHDYDTAAEVLADTIDIVKGVLPEVTPRGAELAISVVEKLVRYAPRAYNWMTEESNRLSEQSSVSASVASATAFLEPIVDDFAAIQSQANAREAAKLVIDPIVGVRREDGAAKIYRTHAILGIKAMTVENQESLERIEKAIDEQHAFLASQIGPDGSLTLKIDQLEKLAREQLGRINQQMALAAKSLHDISKSQSAILGFLTTKEKATALQAHKQYMAELELQAERSSVFLISRLVSIGGDDSFGRRFAGVATASLDVAQAMGRYGTAVKNRAATAGSIILAGNLVGIGLTLASVLAEQGPSNDEIIMKQLGQLFEAVNTMRKEMHERFDHVDRALNTIYSDMIRNFSAIYEQVVSNSVALAGTRALLRMQMDKVYTMAANVERLEELTKAAARLQIENQMRSLIDECVDTGSLSSANVRSCLVRSKNVIATAENANFTNDFAKLPDDLPFLTRQLAVPSYANVNLLRLITLLPDYATPGTSAFGVTKLPNIAYWAAATQAASMVMLQNPAVTRAMDPNDRRKELDRVARFGDNLQLYLSEIRNLTMLERAVDAYQKSVDRTFESGFALVWAVAVQEAMEKELEAQTSFDKPKEAEKLKYWGFNLEKLPNLNSGESFYKALPEIFKKAYLLRLVPLSLSYEVYSGRGEFQPAQFECERQPYKPGSRSSPDEPREGPCKWNLYSVAACKLPFDIQAAATITVNNRPTTVMLAARTALRLVFPYEATNLEAVRYKVGLCDYQAIPPQAVRGITTNADKYSGALKWTVNEAELANARPWIEQQVNRREVEVYSMAFANFAEHVRNALSANAKHEADRNLRLMLDEVDFRKAVVVALMKAGFPATLQHADLLSGNLLSDHGLIDSSIVQTIFARPDEELRRWFAAPLDTKTFDPAAVPENVMFGAITAMRKDKKPMPYWDEVRFVLTGAPDPDRSFIFRGFAQYQQTRFNAFSVYIHDNHRSMVADESTDLVDATVNELRVVRSMIERPVAASANP